MEARLCRPELPAPSSWWVAAVSQRIDDDVARSRRLRHGDVDAIAVNVTVTQPTAPGHVIIYPLGVALPMTSTINYSAGQTRANNAIVQVGTDGSIAVTCGQLSGTTHFIIDVVGYFRFVGP